MEIEFTYELHTTVKEDVKNIRFYNIKENGIQDHNPVDVSGWTQEELEDAMHGCKLATEIKDFKLPEHVFCTGGSPENSSRRKSCCL